MSYSNYNNISSSKNNVGSRVTYKRNNKKGRNTEEFTGGSKCHHQYCRLKSLISHVHALKELVPHSTNVNLTSFDWPASSEIQSKKNRIKMKIGGSGVNNTPLQRSTNRKKDKILLAPSTNLTLPLICLINVYPLL